MRTLLPTLRSPTPSTTRSRPSTWRSPTASLLRRLLHHSRIIHSTIRLIPSIGRIRIICTTPGCPSSSSLLSLLLLGSRPIPRPPIPTSTSSTTIGIVITAAPEIVVVIVTTALWPVIIVRISGLCERGLDLFVDSDAGTGNGFAGSGEVDFAFGIGGVGLGGDVDAALSYRLHFFYRFATWRGVSGRKGEGGRNGYPLAGEKMGMYLFR